MEGFKLDNGTKILDLKDYINSWMLKHPNSKIIVGCDSQRNRRNTVYATVICFYNLGKGAHVIVRRENVNTKMDLFTRLWGEVERLVELSNWIQTEMKWDESLTPENKQIEIHLDLNPDNRFKSNQVYNAGIGYVRGCGFAVYAKPDAFVASFAADHACK